MNPILSKSIARINDSLGTTRRQTLHPRLPLVPFPETKPALEELNGHTDASADACEVLAGRFIETGRMCRRRRTERRCVVYARGCYLASPHQTYDSFPVFPRDAVLR